MSDLVTPARPAWAERPTEQAHLFNPAFIATLLHRMVGDYARKTHGPMPLSLAFLMPAIVLHRATRETLPHSTVTGLLSWLQDNKDQHVTFAGRVRATRSIVQEGLMFALAHQCMSIGHGGISIGSVKLAAGFAKDTGLTEEARECLERASFLGRWFAGAGTETTIYAAWGVAP